MRANLIRIGNSQGVRLPKAIIAAARLGAEIDLEVVDGGGLLLRTASAHPREGWDAMFERALPAPDPEAQAWLNEALAQEADKDWTW
jgi:antitoxin MazE